MLQNPFVPSWKHVFRSLLRQAAYLPDPIARTYMRSYILESYHFHWPHIIPNSGATPHGQILLERRARRLLSALRHANRGFIRPLSKILLLSYGRLGRRRYELLEPYFGLVSSGRPAYRRDPGPLKQAPSHWWPTLALRLLAESQSHNAHVKESKVVPVIRAPYPPKEQYTRGGRKIHKSLVMQKWYESLLERILPPLPDDDWHTLYGLVVGTEPWANPVRRPRMPRFTSLEERTLVELDPLRFDASEKRKSQFGSSSSSPVSQNRSDPLKQRYSYSAWEATVDREVLTPEFLVFGPEKGETFRLFARGRPHTITRRFMTTLWKDIIELVPRFEYIDSPKDGKSAKFKATEAPAPLSSDATNPTEKNTAKQLSGELREQQSTRARSGRAARNAPQLVVRWGFPGSGAPVYYTVDADSTHAFFSGVNEQGKIPRQNKPKRSRISESAPGSSNPQSMHSGAPAMVRQG